MGLSESDRALVHRARERGDSFFFYLTVQVRQMLCVGEIGDSCFCFLDLVRP